MESFYEQPRPAISRSLGALIGSPGVEIADHEIHLDALDRYGRGKPHFVDCVVAARAASRNAPVATFDRGFATFKDVRVKLD